MAIEKPALFNTATPEEIEAYQEKLAEERRINELAEIDPNYSSTLEDEYWERMREIDRTPFDKIFNNES